MSSIVASSRIHPHASPVAYPGAVSLRYAYELDLPGLRAHRVKEYPYLMFYLEREDRIDVWRVLHVRNDIPLWMSDSNAWDVLSCERPFPRLSGTASA